MKVSVPAIQDHAERAKNGIAHAISVVTTVRNGIATLQRTINSIRDQKVSDLEYIVVDAGSTDGTLELLAASGDVVTFWQSEPDRGISDGFNKGIALSTGRYVAIVNADDWLSPGQLQHGIDALEKSGADFAFGDLDYHDTDGTLLHRIQGDPDYARTIAHVMPALNHPTVIVRRTAYEKHGLFDLTLRYAMDYELLLRFHRAGCVGVYVPELSGHMTLAGTSDAGSLRAIREVRAISVAYGYSPLAANMLYVFRVAKDRTRRLVERILPHTLSAALRGLTNKSFVRAG